MNLDSLLNSLDTCGHTGLVISTEESLVLYNSLLILQNENHFRRIFFWGRIFGTERDYYVACGYTKDYMSDRTFYYSTNCRDWGLLPRPTQNGLMLTPFCTTKFQGDPAVLIDVLIDKAETSITPKPQGAHVRQLKEEDRLSAIVHMINNDAVILPRGALFKRPDGIVVENLCFEGLKQNEALEWKMYMHVRTPQNKWNVNLLSTPDPNYAIDFLDSVDKDVPMGCFTIQLSPGGEYVVVKSLYWPGFLLYHKVGTPIYGYCYLGIGKKCLDLPFMLPVV